MLPFELIKDTPYLALSGELWSVFYEYFNRNWPCYKGFLLYMPFEIRPEILCSLSLQNLVHYIVEENILVTQKWVMKAERINTWGGLINPIFTICNLQMHMGIVRGKSGVKPSTCIYIYIFWWDSRLVCCLFVYGRLTLNWISKKSRSVVLVFVCRLNDWK